LFAGCQRRFHEAEVWRQVFIKQRGGYTHKFSCGGPSRRIILQKFCLLLASAFLAYFIDSALRLFAVIFKQFI
jgi:hypothetical protein